MGFLTGISTTTWLILGACIAISGGLLVFHHEAVKNEDNRIVIRTDAHLQKIKGVQDEIINNTPSGHAIAVGMRWGLF